MIKASGLLSERLSKVGALARGSTKVQDCCTEGRAWARRYFKLLIVAFVLHITSAALFIGLVNRQVYDDKYNIHDVRLYAHHDLSVETVRSHLNPPGPTGFLWMAAGVRLLGGNELRDARIANLVSWVLLLVGILVGARYSSQAQVWYAALLATMIFPHSVMAAATTLTEGPALLFAILGTLVWVEATSRLTVTASSFSMLILAGLSLGIAVSCRQYYLALFPAAALFGLLQLPGLGSKEKLVRLLGIILSLSFGSLPVFVLIHVWGGLTSPGSAAGTSFPDWTSYVGLNVFRPLVAAFYCCFYLLPLTLPVVWQVRPTARWLTVLLSTIAGIVAASFGFSLLQPGPLGALIWMASPLPAVQFILFGCIAGLAVYNATQMALLIWGKRHFVVSCPPLTFALLTVLFFAAEQFGVGGNVQFYDRYVLQVAPFLGMIAFSLTPRLGLTRLLTLAAMDVFVHVMLWSHAFSG
jgi:hypothetical protein